MMKRYCSSQYIYFAIYLLFDMYNVAPYTYHDVGKYCSVLTTVPEAYSLIDSLAGEVRGFSL